MVDACTRGSISRRAGVPRHGRPVPRHATLQVMRRLSALAPFRRDIQGLLIAESRHPP